MTRQQNKTLARTAATRLIRKPGATAGKNRVAHTSGGTVVKFEAASGHLVIENPCVLYTARLLPDAVAAVRKVLRCDHVRESR